MNLLKVSAVKTRQQQLWSHMQHGALLKAVREHQILHAGGKSQMVIKDKTSGKIFIASYCNKLLTVVIDT